MITQTTRKYVSGDSTQDLSADLNKCNGMYSFRTLTLTHLILIVPLPTTDALTPFQAAPNPFLLNELCLNQPLDLRDIFTDCVMARDSELQYEGNRNDSRIMYRT